MEGSRGNPLIVSQLVAAQRKLEGTRLSDPLAEIIDARLDALAPEAVRVLRVLAAIRRPIAEQELLGLQLGEGHVTAKAIATALDSGGLAVRNGDRLSIVARALFGSDRGPTAARPITRRCTPTWHACLMRP